MKLTQISANLMQINADKSATICVQSAKICVQKKFRRGFTLIAVILLISFLAITAFSLVTFVTEKIRLTLTREREINAYYMAQAGIYYGLYRYRMSHTNTGPETFNNDTYNRGFEWQIPPVSGNMVTIISTGYCPIAGANRIQKTIEATYNNTTQRLAGLRYANP